jgi:hypothetical protein
MTLIKLESQMKIEDFKKVEFLVKMKAKLDLAVVACDNMDTDAVDAGGIDGFEVGFYGHFSAYSDGSQGIDLNGLYVQDKVVEAIRDILCNQRQDVLDELTNLGVEI